MTFRVQGVLVFADAAARDSARATIQARLDAAPTLDGTVEAGDDDRQRPTLRLNVRFHAQGDADDVEQRLKARAQQAGVVAAHVSWHRCTHDDPAGQSCRRGAGAQLREWTR